MAFTLGRHFYPSSSHTSGDDFIVGSAFGSNDGDIVGTLDDIVGEFIAENDVFTGEFTVGLDFHVVDIYTPGFLLSTEPLSPTAEIRGQLSDLVGGLSGHYVHPDLQGAIEVSLDDLSGELNGNIVQAGRIVGELDSLAGGLSGWNAATSSTIEAVLDGLSGEISAYFDYNVLRLLAHGACAPCDDAAYSSIGWAAASEQAKNIPIDVCASSIDATPMPATICLDALASVPLTLTRCAPSEDAAPLTARNTSANAVLAMAAGVVCSPGAQAAPLSGFACALFDLLAFVRSLSCHPVEDAGRALRDLQDTVYFFDPIADIYSSGFDFIVPNDAHFMPGLHFVGSASYTLTVRDSMQRGLIRRERCAPNESAARSFGRHCAPADDAMRPPPGVSVPYDPPPPPPPEPPPGHETLIIPTQSSYVMQHNISVVTLVGNTPVPMSSVSLSLSADTFAWQFSGTLADPNALALIEIVDNEPVALKVTIDGYDWHVLVEEVEHSRVFAKNSITVKGRSVSALLGGPYEQPNSATYGSALTVQQLAEMQLPFGWTLGWTQVTWLVPGGAWSYANQTPIQVLAGIANDTGSMLVPARDSQSFTMMPRYPYWPWDFAAATPDLIVPESAIKSVSLRPRLGTQANGVYVHGGDVGGVIGWCRFTGTDGARLAETISNNLMTDVIGCRALGSRILAGQYTQPIIKSLSMPLDGATFPLASIGMLADITLGAETVRGIINSVSIEANFGSVMQTLQIGEETPNVWALFKELLPRDPLLIGTLASTDGTVSVLTLLDGGVITVRGTGTVGQKYYIRSGRIEDEAPTMVQSEIVV